MNIQPGNGYTFSTSGCGTTINVEQPLIQYDSIDADEPYSFKIYGFHYDETEEVYLTNVFPGTVNNFTPSIDSTPITNIPAPSLVLSFSEEGYSYIYLDCGISTGTYPYNPEVISSSTQLTSSDSHGYLLLGTIFKDPVTSSVSIWQYIKSSLWTDRIKIGSSDAKYYFGAV